MKDNKKQLKTIFTGISIISGLFVFAVLSILIYDYYKIKKNPPLNSAELIQLRLQLKHSPDDLSLRKKIRKLDYNLRKTYFYSENKHHRGVLLLAAALAVFIISLHTRSAIEKKLEPPSRYSTADNPFNNAAKTRFYMTASLLWGFTILFITLYLKERRNPEQWTNREQSPLPSIMKETREFTKNWTEFRGKNGSARSSAKNIPAHWNEKSREGILWKTKIPLPGYSSPIIWNDKIFLTGGDKKIRKVFCLDRKNGKLLWGKSIPFSAPPGSKIPSVTEDTGFAAPTMTTDGIRVFAIFATGDIAALDMDGTLLWEKNPGVPDNHYAYSSSLLYYKEKLIVQYDDSTRTKLIALNPLDGSIIWENTRKAAISWASPIAVQIPVPGKTITLDAIIAATSSTISAHSPDSGKIIWSTKCMDGEVAPSPTYHDGMIFVANEFASAVALDALSGKIIWQKDELDLPDVASPLATDGKLYLAASSGILTCLDSKTGNKKWIKEYDEGFYSSPILVGDVIYLLNMKGKMFIIKDSDKYELVSESSVNDITVTTPAFIENNIYIRGNKYLYSIDTSE
jgi:outer membrane protein assembly factor BamB